MIPRVARFQGHLFIVDGEKEDEYKITTTEQAVADDLKLSRTSLMGYEWSLWVPKNKVEIIGNIQENPEYQYLI